MELITRLSGLLKAITYSTYDKSIVSGALSIIVVNYCTKTKYERLCNHKLQKKSILKAKTFTLD
jgi:hypothetical protein